MFSFSTQETTEWEQGISFAQEARAMVLPEHKPPTPYKPKNLKPDKKPGSALNVSFDQLDVEQQQIADYMLRGMNFCLIGAAGTGKTSAIVAAIMRIVHRLPAVLSGSEEYYSSVHCNPEHKHLTRGMPGFLVVSFTNKAVLNLARKFPTIKYEANLYDQATGNWKREELDFNLQKNALTIHKTTEFQPQQVDRIGANGEVETVKQFIPARGASNIIPPEIRYIIIEESSMVTLELFQVLRLSAPNARFIFMGDLNQLLPVGGYPTLGGALTRLPVIQLTHIYRHGGPVQDLAHLVRKGETKYLPYQKAGYVTRTEESTVVNYTYPQDMVSAPDAADITVAMLKKFFQAGVYYPGVDMVLIPQFPSSETGYGIQDISNQFYSWLDSHYKRPTYYVRVGSGPVVLAVGDVMYSDKTKHEYLILAIRKNKKYKGIVYPPKNYNTRDPDTWLAIHDARNSDAEVAAQDADMLVATELASMSTDLLAEIDFSDTTKHRTSALDGENDKVRKQATHELVLLDLDFLPVAIANLGYEKGLAAKQEDFLRQLVQLVLQQDYLLHECADTRTDLDRLGELHTFAKEQGLADFFKEYLMVTAASDDLANLISPFVTVHKAQGSQGRRVIFCAHHTNRVHREMIYTAITRAQETLITITHGGMWGPNPNLREELRLKSGVTSQRIKGVTLDEKIASFTSLIDSAAVRATTSGSKTIDIDELFLQMIQENESAGGTFDFHDY